MKRKFSSSSYKRNNAFSLKYCLIYNKGFEAKISTVQYTKIGLLKQVTKIEFLPACKKARIKIK